MKLLICLLSILFSISIHAQQMPAQSAKDDYLKKSKRQNTIGWVFAGTGAALTTTGLVLGAGSLDDEIVSAFNGEESKKFDGAAVVFWSGVTAMAASIPFFISATKNKKRAAASSVSFLMERIRIPNKTLSEKYYPAIVMRFKLGR